MKCPYCGEPMAPEAKFCANCGAARPLSDQIEEKSSFEQTGSSYQNSPHVSGSTGTQAYRQEKSGFAIASLVLGIIGILFGGLICGILAIIFANKAGRIAGPSGIGTAGKVLGIIAIIKVVAVVILAVVLGISIFNSGGNLNDFNDIIQQFDVQAMISGRM